MIEVKVIKKTHEFKLFRNSEYSPKKCKDGNPSKRKRNVISSFNPIFGGSLVFSVVTYKAP